MKMTRLQALEVLARLDARQDAALRNTGKGSYRVILRSEGTTHGDFSDLSLLQSRDNAEADRRARVLGVIRNYTRAFFEGTSAYVKKSLNSMEERVPPKYFFRANRQYIVNLQAIVSIEEAVHDGYNITMRDGMRLEVSRRNAADLKELLSF